MIVQFHGYHIEPPVAHFTDGHQTIGKWADFNRGAPQNDRLHAFVVIEVYVHR